MVINYAELRMHGWNMLMETCLVGGSVCMLGNICQLGVKGFTASLIDYRVGFTPKGALVYLVIARAIYEMVDTIFYRLGWREGMPRMLTGLFVSGIFSFTSIIAAKEKSEVAYLVTCLAVMQLALWTLGGVILMAKSAKGVIKACSDTDPVV